MKFTAEEGMRLLAQQQAKLRRGPAAGRLKKRGGIEHGSHAVWFEWRVDHFPANHANSSMGAGDEMAAVKAEREALTGSWLAAGQPRPACFPVVVTFELVRAKLMGSPNGGDDPNNLDRRLKHYMDALCACWGVDDGDGRVIFEDAVQIKDPDAVAPYVRVRFRVQGGLHG